jgi:Transposase DDE domain
MATSGRGSGVVGFNVQVAVDTEHHLIITHKVTNVGSDRAQLAHMAKETKATLEAESLDVVADRGYFSGEEILKCDKAGITVTLPKPITRMQVLQQARFPLRGCGGRLHLSCRREARLLIHDPRTRIDAAPLFDQCLPALPHQTSLYHRQERRITRWEHENIVEAVQRRLDEHPEKMRQRRETVEHPFGTIKARMGATHFLMKTLPRVASEMALHVLAYNLTRVMNIMGIQPLVAAMRA